MSSLPPAVAWRDDRLWLLDQTRLPQEVVVDCMESVDEAISAIQALRVRGAPAIGIAAAYGLLIKLAAAPDIRAEFAARAARMLTARPTAVNLSAAVLRMRACADTTPDGDLIPRLTATAIAIHDEDRELCRRIGEAGAPLVARYPRVLTHCNAGALAVSELGTALAPIYVAHRRGVAVQVIADETRPLLQGARLTTLELHRAGVPVTLITDSSAASMMSAGRVDMAIVGADRVAANGDTANKIGTLGVAILCKHFNLPFYVACPGTTIDLATPGGYAIEIEERDASEVTMIGDTVIAPPGIHVLNYAFDVTPSALITGFITDAGIIRPPFADGLRQFG
jgi:methylthioribose-1-phosphate isomerase